MRWRMGAAAVAVVVAGSGCATTRPGDVSQLPRPVKQAPPPAPTRMTSVPRYSPPAPASRSFVDGAPPDWMPPRGIARRWKYIVVHHSATPTGSASAFDRYHRNVNHWDELGYHFVIGNGRGSGDGQIEVGPRWRKQKHGAHCKTPNNDFNDHGIGICLVGDFGAYGPSAAQMASLTKLVRYLSNACGVSPRNVVTHRGVTGKTECPGRRFPLDRLQRAVAGDTRSGSYRASR